MLRYGPHGARDVLRRLALPVSSRSSATGATSGSALRPASPGSPCSTSPTANRRASRRTRSSCTRSCISPASAGEDRERVCVFRPPARISDMVRGAADAEDVVPRSPVAGVGGAPESLVCRVADPERVRAVEEDRDAFPVGFVLVVEVVVEVREPAAPRSRGPMTPQLRPLARPPPEIRRVGAAGPSARARDARRAGACEARSRRGPPPS